MDNELNRPHIKPGSIKYTKGYGLRLFFIKVFNLLIVFISLLAVGLAIYIYIKQPVKTSNGYVMATPNHKLYEPKERVVIVDNYNYNLFYPIKRALVTSEVFSAEIVAGPYGEIKMKKDNQVAIYGDTTTIVFLENKDNRYLDEEYVVRKIDSEGFYIEGSPYEIVTKEKILGLIIKNDTKSQSQSKLNSEDKSIY